MKSVCQAPPVFVVLALVASMTPRAEAADPPKPSQPAAAPAAPAKMSAADEAKAREAAAKKAKEVELAVAKTIAASGPAIDACTQSYTAEFPTEDGRAQIQTTVAKNGMVTKANVTTPLPSARNLIPCLMAVAKSWKFPPLAPNTESASLQIAVAVKKGQKFALKMPGEKTPDGTQQPQTDQEGGFLQFVPTGWVESPQ